jgi:peptidoglycan/xylan/chitin deacetylase (PgdA/CDA1 family)
VRRRQLLNHLVAGGAGAIIGTAVCEGIDEQQTAQAAPRSWASTIRPETVRGSARLWWSADPAVGRRLALTFDDGPTDQFTARVLDLLAAVRVTATFFVVGALVRRHPDLVRRARDAGHEIGNHSEDHVSAAVTDQESVRAGVLRCSDTIEEFTGSRPRWFRPPRGEITTATMLTVREAQLDLAMWSLGRGNGPDTDSEGVGRHLSRAVGPGEVVDLHDGIGRSAWVGSPDRQLIARRAAEVTALPQVLRRWLDDGYTLCTMSQLIPASPGDRRPGHGQGERVIRDR